MTNLVKLSANLTYGNADPEKGASKSTHIAIGFGENFEKLHEQWEDNPAPVALREYAGVEDKKRSPDLILENPSAFGFIEKLNHMHLQPGTTDYKEAFRDRTHMEYNGFYAVCGKEIHRFFFKETPIDGRIDFVSQENKYIPISGLNHRDFTDAAKVAEINAILAPEGNLKMDVVGYTIMEGAKRCAVSMRLPVVLEDGSLVNYVFVFWFTASTFDVEQEDWLPNLIVREIKPL